MIPPNIFSGTLLWAPLPLFLLQILIILVVVRCLGKVLHAVNQPMVIGEIIAGVLLGPSVFGYIPGFTSTIFPDSSKDFLTLFSSVGLCFFMFFLGLEVDPVFMMQSWRSTLPIAFVSMSIPFGVGVSVATWLFTLEPDEQYNRLSFLLFIGTVFSFSAFPVLARILDSTKLISSPVGIQALGLAALEDVVAWCVLALIISYSSTAGGTAPGAVVPQSSAWNAILIFVILVAFIAILMAVIRPIINYFYIRKQNNGENLESDFIPYLFFGFLIASWFTETLGIHAFFGSFLFGCILPKEGDLIPILAPRIELLIVHIFLPIYFANSGMKTQLQKLDSLEIWLYTLIIIVVASVAKITSVTLSSKLVLGIRKKRIRSFLEEYSNDSSDDETENEFVDATCENDVEAGTSAADTTTAHHDQAPHPHPRADHLQQLHQHQTSQLNLFQHSSINNDDLPRSHSIENIDYDADAEDYTQEGTDEVSLSTDSNVLQVKLHRNHLPAASNNSNSKSNSKSNSRDSSSNHLTSSSTTTTTVGGGGGSKRSSIIRTVHPAMVAEVSHTPTTNGGKRNSPTGDNTDPKPQRTQVSGIHTPISVNSSSNNLVSHSNRTHAIPDLAPEVLVDEEDQDEFGLDIHTGLPIVSDDEALIQEFSMNSWVHCLTLGVLLNSRGLVALIVLNIGLDKGIIGPKIFSMMLTMSLVCTCLTSPIVYALYGYRWQKALLKMQAADLAEAVQLEEEAEEAYIHELSHKDTTLMYPGQVFSQDYHDQLAQMMEANRKANAITTTENAPHSNPSTTVSNSATESPPTESVPADPLQEPLLSPPTTELTSSPPLSASPPTTIPQAQTRFRAKGRAASSIISIGSSHRSNESNSPDSQSGSYIPPILARLRSTANGSAASSAGTSPNQPNHMPPVMPQLGLGFNGLVSPRPVSSSSGVSRFGAPQLSSQLSIRNVGSPAPSISIPQSAASPAPSLARRQSVFTLLGTSPSVSGMQLTGPGVDGARSISTRTAMQQPSILHQRQASRIESGMNTPRNNAGGSGTPKNQPSTPRGHARVQSVFAASSRHIFSQQAPLSPNSATSTTSTNSARSPPPNLGRAKTYIGLSQTPTNFSMVPTIAELPPPLNLGHKAASTSTTSFAASTRPSNNSIAHDSDED